MEMNIGRDISPMGMLWQYNIKTQQPSHVIVAQESREISRKQWDIVTKDNGI